MPYGTNDEGCAVGGAQQERLSRHSGQPAQRKILHVDMDAFYAAVEQRDDPRLRGLPIAVGGGGQRGVVMTASYEARRFGVRSAMPGARAARLCPDLVFVRPRFEVYKAVSDEIRAVFREWTELVEPLSLDEAYLDVTQVASGTTATAIARAIKQRIVQRTSLRASAGVSFNKFLAKLASDMRKPDGLVVITPEKAPAILDDLPIERFHGIGPATAKRLHAHGIACGRDLRVHDEASIEDILGRSGRSYWRLTHGIDDRPVSAERRRKSISVEDTFPHDLVDERRLIEELRQLAERLATRAARAMFCGRTVTLKIKYRDFRVATRQTPVACDMPSAVFLESVATGLLARSPLEAPVRLLGIGLTAGASALSQHQLDLPLAHAPPAGRRRE